MHCHLVSGGSIVWSTPGVGIIYLLDEPQVKKHGLPTKAASWPCPFVGVGGISCADEVACNIAVGELGLKLNPYILKDVFAVMSVGKHCRKDKMTFVW